MGMFLRWLALRESNSRKRRIKAALRGDQPPLPGSYAANPNTNVRAMKVADKKGVVCKEDQTPNYSIDRWIDMANDLGDDLSVMRQDADDQEKELDKDIETKKKKTETEEKDKKAKEAEEDTDKEEKDLWNKIQKHLKKSEKDSSEEHSDSSGH